MTDEELMRAFEAGRVPPGGFHHRQHVRVAWNYLRIHPLPEALGRFSAGLKSFALAQGAPNLYHETITVAFVLLINERLDETAGTTSGRRSRSAIRTCSAGSRRSSTATTTARRSTHLGPAASS